jgi:hypothetical protein
MGEEPATDPKTGKPPKTNPWKLVDEYKAKLAKAEADQLEISKRAIDKTEWQKTQERLAAQEKRNQELEDEIRYVNFSKSKEFADKYQAPYEAAWKRSMTDLKDVVINDNGQQRTLQAQDVLALVNMPLQKARETAEEMFGSLANDVMNHRNEIRRLFDEQSQALEDARKNGSTRDQERQRQFQEQNQQLTRTVTETWKKANETALADPAVGKYLKPVEGDAEWNSRLERATKLADQAFGENSLAPGLTPEQRSQIVARHAAVRNRSIAYSMLRYENSNLSKKLADAEAKLKAYQTNEPPAGGSVQQPNGEVKGFDRIRQGLAKIAR